MKKILLIGVAALLVAGSIGAAKNWSEVRNDYWLLRTDSQRLIAMDKIDSERYAPNWMVFLNCAST
jgi:hypothetical protein